MKIRTFLYLSSIILLLFCPFCNADPREELNPIPIGALLHLTGDLAMQGAAFREGIEIASEEINNSGGIHGRPLKIIFEDTQLKASVSFTAAKKLTELDKVVATVVSRPS